MTLKDWTIKHDLFGEGSIMKTINEKGVGYDRPSKHDELLFSVKVSQQGKTLLENPKVALCYENQESEYVTPTISKILASLKREEKASSLVQAKFV